MQIKISNIILNSGNTINIKKDFKFNNEKQFMENNNQNKNLNNFLNSDIKYINDISNYNTDSYMDIPNFYKKYFNELESHSFSTIEKNKNYKDNKINENITKNKEKEMNEPLIIGYFSLSSSSYETEKIPNQEFRKKFSGKKEANNKREKKNHLIKEIINFYPLFTKIKINF